MAARPQLRFGGGARPCRICGRALAALQRARSDVCDAMDAARRRGTQLRRWLARHPGATWADAVEDYMGHVPERHVGRSCVYHGERGCSLPRTTRSDTCNVHACETLERVEVLARTDAAVVVVVGIVRQHELGEAALVGAQEVRVLTRNYKAGAPTFTA